MKRTIYIFALLVMSATAAFAQKYALKGIVLDGVDNESLPGAAVSLLNAKDSTQVGGVMTDAEGNFTVNASKTGNYILKLSYMGYVTMFKNVTIQKSAKTQELGTFVMQQDAQQLKEMQITAAAAKVEMKEDTFVYNADAYKLPEGSNLEELVRQLPGAEISEDGTLKINGKTVSKILMKGKELFGNDKDMAMKNISTKIINKIKAYDKKSDYSRVTGIDDGEEETVLDLTVKRGMGEGWNVNVDIAAGDARQDRIPNAPNSLKFPKPLYSGMLNASRFSDNLQFMLVLNSNNINNGSGRWGGFGGGSGVTTTTMTGLNVTWTNGIEKYTEGYLEVGGNVRYNERKSSNMTMNNSEMFLSATSSSFSNAFNQSRSTSRNVNADFRLEWMPDSLTSLTFRPSYSHSENKNWGDNTSVTFNKNPYDITDNPLKDYTDDALFTEEIRVNSNENKSHSLGTSNNGNANIQLNRRLGKPGRNITLNAGGNISKSDNKSFAWSDIKYYQNGTSKLQDRFTMSPSESWNAQGRLSYTEPITKNLNLQMSYQYQRRFSDNDRSMYNLENLIGESLSAQGVTEYGGTAMTRDILEQIYNNGDVPSVSLDNMMAITGYGADWKTFTLDAMNSQYATYKENNHDANLMFRYTYKFENEQELRFNAGVSGQPQHTLMHYAKGAVDTTVTRTTFNWAPRINLRWKISGTSQFRFNYNARMSQPSMTQLMEVTDDSNPLNISTGNAGLRSNWNNNIFTEYNGYRAASQTSWYVRGGYGNTKNSISSATIYNETSGVRYTRPMNINGNWNTWGNFNFNTAMGEKKFWNFSNNIYANYNYRLGYLSTNVDKMQYEDAAQTRVDLRRTFEELQSSGQLKESATKTMGVGDWARLSYRHTFYDDRYSVDISANSGFNYNHTRSTAQTNNNINSWNFNYGGNATLMFPWNISFTTNITEQSRRGYDDKSMNTNELIWNASIQKSFLKGNAATIKAEWNDILHQRSNVSRAISEFSRSDTYTNNINSYFMIHFIFKLNLMGDKQARADMGPGGGFGGPGGRPEGGRPGGRF